ncbi:MAG: phosphate ABC transporter permease PtsA [Chloroflexi bacterium]|nr:MAG: phosphate ABC transporter permease PtsA [Chloroflexota bacterium]
MRRVLVADRVATATLWAIALAALLLLAAMIVHLVWAAVGTLSASFVLGDPEFLGLGGVGPVLWNSFYMLFLTALITVPAGIAAGIYMAEYAAEGRLTSAIRFAQEAISSIPSIVVGLFGLVAFVNLTGWGFSALAGSLALSVFNLPLMARLTEQALRAVPADERYASLALGSTKWQMIRHVVVPLAIPGIVTGIILTAGRIFGEAAALLFTAGLTTPSNYHFENLNVLDPKSPWSPFRPATTLAVYIWKVQSEGLGSSVKQIADGASALLLLCVLGFNVGARMISRVLVYRITRA